MLELDLSSVSSHSMTIAECLGLLSRAHHLESVVLSNALHLGYGDQDLAYEQYHAFPPLKRIVMKSQFDGDLVALFSRLELSTACKVHAEYQGITPSDIHEPSLLIPLLTRPIYETNVSSRPIKKASIASWSLSQMHSVLAAWGDEDANDIYDATICVTWARPERPWHDIVQEFCEALRLADITVLEISASRQDIEQPGALESAIRAMPAIRRLTMSGVDDTRIVALLRHMALLPRLEDLAMMRMTAYGRNSADAMELLAMLRARRGYGRIKRLALRKLPGDETRGRPKAVCRRARFD
ncbi:hypothetical protein EWM64_g9579 [Hericium alpestre]|uniref:Uncharacterized protein n=1 Tax=Hericium alpestre TaxID=135208 RepID=A0A4Y9ZKK9_9AGAM|nr:hypothetical protein EWM64_g9579 [Hericium alpestre]